MNNKTRHTIRLEQTEQEVVEQAAWVMGMSIPGFVQRAAVWTAVHLNEQHRVLPLPTTDRERQIKALRLQIMLDPFNPSPQHDGQQRLLFESKSVGLVLQKLKSTILAVVDKGEVGTLLPGAAQWCKHHAALIKAKVNATKIQVPHDFVEIVDGAVVLDLFTDGPVHIQLGPRQRKKLVTGVPVVSLVFERPSRNKWRMLITQEAPKRKPNRS